MTKHDEFVWALDSLQLDLSKASRALAAAQHKFNSAEVTKPDKKFIQKLAEQAQTLMTGLDKMI